MTTTVVSERFRPKYTRDSATIRRALERSVLYSEELGIDLAQRTDAACFQWFLASLRFRCPNCRKYSQENLSRLHAPWADDAEKDRCSGMGLPGLSSHA